MVNAHVALSSFTMCKATTDRLSVELNVVLRNVHKPGIQGD